MSGALGFVSEGRFYCELVDLGCLQSRTPSAGPNCQIVPPAP